MNRVLRFIVSVLRLVLYLFFLYLLITCGMLIYVGWFLRIEVAG